VKILRLQNDTIAVENEGLHGLGYHRGAALGSMLRAGMPGQTHRPAIQAWATLIQSGSFLGHSCWRNHKEWMQGTAKPIAVCIRTHLALRNAPDTD
jgi:hypothetical protein